MITSNGYRDTKGEHDKSSDSFPSCRFSLLFSFEEVYILTVNLPHPHNTRLQKVLLYNRLQLLLVACKKMMLTPSIVFWMEIHAEI